MIMTVAVKVKALAKCQVLFFAFSCTMIMFDALGELPGLFINTLTLPIQAPGRSVLPTHLGVLILHLFFLAFSSVLSPLFL